MKTQNLFLKSRNKAFTSTHMRSSCVDMLNRGKTLVDVAMTLNIPMSTLNSFVNNKIEFDYWKNKTYQKNSTKTRNRI